MSVVTHITMHPSTWNMIKNAFYLVDEAAFTAGQVHGSLDGKPVRTNILIPRGKVILHNDNQVVCTFHIERTDGPSPANDVKVNAPNPGMIHTRN